MATDGNGNKPYKATLRGRLEALLASSTAFLRRSGAGSIAIAIGALGAAALLATTLIFPPPPVQRIFQTDAGNDGIQAPASPDERDSDEPITVPTGPNESDQVADSDGSTSASTPQVLGTFTENGSVAGGSKGGDTISGSTTVGTTPSLDEDGAQPGSGSGSGSDPDVDEDTTTSKENDDDDISEGEGSDDTKSEDSKSKDGGSKDSKQKKNHPDDSDDTDDTADSGSKNSKAKDSKDSDDSDDD